MTTTLLTLRFNTQAQLDIARITRELTDLQRQVASGFKSNELSGYGVGASRLLNTRGLVELTDARAGAALQLQSRFGVQASALGQGAEAAFNLAQAIREAISSDNVGSLSTELTVAFASSVSALNETWNGQPLFAGERLTGQPVRVISLDELIAAAPDQIYDEAERSQVVDLGPGAQITLADKASNLSTGLFDVFREMKLLIDSWGPSPPGVIDSSLRAQLQEFAGRLDSARDVLIGAQGRAGQLETRLIAERQRLNDRSLLLQKEIGDQADADPAQLSIQINTLLAQYQATAKTFADISSLSLLHYLR